MDVIFASARLKSHLDSLRVLTKVYGPENAATIRSRLDSLRFADNLGEMETLPGRFEALRGDRAGTFSLRLKHGYRLIFAAVEEGSRPYPDGSLNLTTVRAVMILEIVDYHD